MNILNLTINFMP